MKIIEDGDAYLVVKDNFVNLQESEEFFFIDEKEYKELVDPIEQLIFYANDNLRKHTLASWAGDTLVYAIRKLVSVGLAITGADV